MPTAPPLTQIMIRESTPELVDFAGKGAQTPGGHDGSPADGAGEDGYASQVPDDPEGFGQRLFDELVHGVLSSAAEPLRPSSKKSRTAASRLWCNCSGVPSTAAPSARRTT